MLACSALPQRSQPWEEGPATAPLKPLGLPRALPTLREIHSGPAPLCKPASAPPWFSGHIRFFNCPWELFYPLADPQGLGDQAYPRRGHLGFKSPHTWLVLSGQEH